MDESGNLDVPLACTLTADDGATRLPRREALAQKGLPSARCIGHRLDVRYLSGLGVTDELRALAAAERTCCSFVTWGVSQEGQHVVLHVVADPSAPDDVAPIAAMFGAD